MTYISYVLKRAHINHAVLVGPQLKLSLSVVVLVLELEHHQAVSDGLSILVFHK